MIARKHRYAIFADPMYLAHPRNIPAGLFDIAHIRQRPQPRDKRRTEVDVGGVGVVIDHNRYGHRLVDALEMLEQFVVRRAGIIRRNYHQAVGADSLRLARIAYRLIRPFVRRPDEHRRSPVGGVHHGFCNHTALAVRNRKKLARAAKRYKPVRAARYLPIHHAAQGRGIDAASVGRERRRENGMAA